MKIRLIIFSLLSMFGMMDVFAVSDYVHPEYDFVQSGIYYKKTGGNKVKVVNGSPNYNCYSGDITINWLINHYYDPLDPSKFTQYEVNAIDDDAFRECENLTSITLGTYVTTIGARAFYDCPKLHTVSLGTYTNTIGTLAFSRCKALKNVYMGSYTHTVGKSAFAFCTALDNVNFGGYTYTLLDDAFRMCTSLEHINITGTYMNYIGPYAFAECYNLREFKCNDYMQNICKDAFFLCRTMRWVNVDPQSATCNVHKFAFEQCKSLYNAYFGKKVITFGNGAFMQCTSLEENTFDAFNLKYKNKSLIFYGCFGMGWTGLFF